ncbi:SPOR domain-containing protein, partial [Rhodovarius lipocyclicus]|uniref:SPOR domain-containing protein n=1 Tax=Rhodovarius lipocyclicus TaxID=268410 RepID=UPI001F452824
PAATPERPAHVLTPPGSAPAAAPAAARATPAPAGRGNIQLAAVASEAAARTEWDRIKRRVPELASHSPSFLKVEREGRAPIWRLRVQGVGDARALCGRLRERGVACDPV